MGTLRLQLLKSFQTQPTAETCILLDAGRDYNLVLPTHRTSDSTHVNGIDLSFTEAYLFSFYIFQGA